MFRTTIFRKIVLLLVLLLLPILILFGLSSKVSVNVVEKELLTSSMNRLTFFLRQMDADFDQLSLFPVIVAADPYVREVIDRREAGSFEQLRKESRLYEKLSLQSVASSYLNVLSLYLPDEKKVISSNKYLDYDEAYLRTHIFNGWAYEGDPTQPERKRFVRQVVEPPYARQLEEATALIQVSIGTANITHALDQYKEGGRGDPFLYAPGYEPILNSSSQQALVQQLIPLMDLSVLEQEGRQIVKLNGESYLVNAVESKNLGWLLVDYVPLQQIVKPITTSRNLFYIVLSLMLMTGILAAFLLYRNVQIPILNLLSGVQRLKRGDFSTRIGYRSNNEFDLLFQRFNEMAEQIQQLIETVYEEKIRSREATLKQLQSQINPHFLYNCLFFIVNTAKLGDREAVVAMAHNLGEYYRYATKTAQQLVPLSEELKLVKNYLVIQNLRMQRIHYEVEIPGEMLGLLIPRLLLQPIVENAVVHGLEPLPRDGVILLTAGQDDTYYWIAVEDTGVGMTPEEIAQLESRIQAPAEEEIGTGVRNVHQRLVYLYGEGSGLRFASRPEGGLRVTLVWRREPRLAENGGTGSL
ncbi:histidine kinase [Paenibacillus sp. J31TS4]|uniref:sensor histidine kinase n=1 Tax=Paenibacillus sp. J31TS4 TaxID=2807195 RepID=UPI001B29DEB2|nr:sensor histidine kinase [Paenibacillus sp. J31TS4]GIP38040.1 histidine kinase [Paenibacillus sp. J31TS4]